MTLLLVFLKHNHVLKGWKFRGGRSTRVKFLKVKPSRELHLRDSTEIVSKAEDETVGTKRRSRSKHVLLFSRLIRWEKEFLRDIHSLTSTHLWLRGAQDDFRDDCTATWGWSRRCLSETYHATHEADHLALFKWICGCDFVALWMTFSIRAPYPEVEFIVSSLSTICASLKGDSFQAILQMTEKKESDGVKSVEHWYCRAILRELASHDSGRRSRIADRIPPISSLGWSLCTFGKVLTLGEQRGFYSNVVIMFSPGSCAPTSCWPIIAWSIEKANHDSSRVKRYWQPWDQLRHYTSLSKTLLLTDGKEIFWETRIATFSRFHDSFQANHHHLSLWIRAAVQICLKLRFHCSVSSSKTKRDSGQVGPILKSTIYRMSR
jgi:hypothetical protein